MNNELLSAIQQAASLARLALIAVTVVVLVVTPFIVIAYELQTKKRT